MPERESFYEGIDVFAKEAPKPRHRQTPAERIKAEMRPSINEARQRLAEKVLVEVSDQDWRARTLCAYLAPHEIGYFTSSSAQDIVRAKLVCDSCDVKEQCLAYALRTNENTNVYGGKSEQERRSMKRAEIFNRRQQR